MKLFDIPGLSMAVINDGKIDWTRGFGFQDNKQKTLVTPNTLFQAGSVSKPIAALGALALVQQGVLNLDENINVYLKTWKVPDNEFTTKEKVTLRRLLTHSAGFTVHDFPGYTPGEKKPELIQILNGTAHANTAKIEVDFVPGIESRYSGGGYTVLQQLINDVTNIPFHEAMKKLVFEPLKMDNSSYEQPLPLNKQNKAASGYYTDDTNVKGNYHTYPEKAAAGLWTTAQELAKYIIEVQKMMEGKSNNVVKQALAKQMLTRQIGDWGLGLTLQGRGKNGRFSHNGENAGFQTMLVGFVHNGKGAVMMSNSNNDFLVFPDILQSIAREYKWPEFDYLKQQEIDPINHEDLEKFQGYFTSTDLPLNIEIKMIKEKLYGQATGQNRFPLIPMGQSKFISPLLNLTLYFMKDKNNKINSNRFILNQGGRDYNYIKKD